MPALKLPIRSYADVVELHDYCARTLEEERQLTRLSVAEAASACGMSETGYRDMLDTPRDAAVIASVLARQGFRCMLTIETNTNDGLDEALPDMLAEQAWFDTADQFGARRAETLAHTFVRERSEKLRNYVRRLYEIDCVDLEYNPALAARIEAYSTDPGGTERDAHWYSYWAGFQTRATMLGLAMVTLRSNATAPKRRCRD